MTYGRSRREKHEAASRFQAKLWKIVASRASCSHRLAHTFQFVRTLNDSGSDHAFTSVLLSNCQDEPPIERLSYAALLEAGIEARVRRRCAAPSVLQ